MLHKENDSVPPEALHFRVEGPIVGAVRTTQRQKWVDKRYHRYEAFKRQIRLIANACGVPEALAPTDRASVTVSIYWKKKSRCDCDNVLKSVLDGLWKNDRRVLSASVIAYEHSSNNGEYMTVDINVRSAQE